MNIQFPENGDVDAWQITIWNLPEKDVSRPQKLQLMLMLEAAFNQFDPFVVVRDLLQNRHLWQGVLMERSFPLPEQFQSKPYPIAKMATDLISLRDIGGNHWNVDALYILTSEGKEAEWQRICQSWRADEMDYIVEPEAGQLLGAYAAGLTWKILRLWWD